MRRIIQLFQWRLTDIIPIIHELRHKFTAIQISPLQPIKDDKGEWWKLYQPCDLTIGNYLGTKEDLKKLTEECKKYNIEVYADLVLNHVAGADDGSIKPHEKVNPKLINKYFMKSTNRITNWKNRYEVINYSIGVPGLRTDNYDLQDIIIKFIENYIECGVKGFRIDAAKNIALPTEHCDFFTRVIKRFRDKGIYTYAEVILADKWLIDEYCKYTDVLTDSFGSDKNKLVTFVESHDSYLDDIIGYTKKLSEWDIIREYKYLCNIYNNTLFYNRPFSDMYRLVDNIK